MFKEDLYECQVGNRLAAYKGKTGNRIFPNVEQRSRQKFYFEHFEFDVPRRY